MIEEREEYERDTDNVVALYLREVGNIPLLTPEEELELTRRCHKGRAAEEQLKKGMPDHEARQRLLKEMEEGHKARERLVKANSRLVVSVARNYLGRGVPLADLIQEGNLGLMRAIEGFDPERGYRFSTYAIWWIRQAISRAVAYQGRVIRLPAHVVEKVSRLNRASRRLTKELGREPDEEELAEEMDISREKVADLSRVAAEPVSLDIPVGEEETSTLAEFIEDEVTLPPTEEASQSLLEEQLEEALASLTPREAEVIRLRFGLDGGRGYTLEEVGQKIGLTRERARQIQAEALRRLRHPSRSRLLKGYLN
ncbi:MAG: sigma-70 family RNA polymerase sigma factor [Anaerolineae bacterium]|nr:sigma-70 family RNA polymerase sigma factor [Anaerolineae bacterium]